MLELQTEKYKDFCTMYSTNGKQSNKYSQFIIKSKGYTTT